MQWNALLGRPGSSNRADLALTLGVSRARVTQVLSVFDASEVVREALEVAAAKGVVVTERMWRRLRRLPDRELVRRLQALETEGSPKRRRGIRANASAA